MPINHELLSKLACPNCGNELAYNEIESKLVCTVYDCSFGIEKNVPIMISAKDPKAIKSDDDSNHPSQFDYLEHYKTDAEAFDYFQEQSGATAHSEHRLREYIVSQIPKDAESILDVGSGSAWLAKHFQGSNVFICSMDATIVNTSKALQKYPSAKHAAVLADAFALPFKQGSFDCIVAAEIIEHVPNPAAFVHSLLKVIKSGGALIISTPYKEIIRYELCIHCNQKTPINAHLHSFDENKLRSHFAEEHIANFRWNAFNNKLLLFARTHIILRYLPFSLWKLVDRIANAIYKKPVNIVIKIIKA
jgi:2-polyprenyl-3-methyl-5-hydroxy-6-metoxy-1,4-benzoquinol methylase